MILYFGILITTTLSSYILFMNKGVETVKVKMGDCNISFMYKRGFLPTFVILAFFSAVREGIGIDYYSYINHIMMIQKDSSHHYMEIGFKKLVQLLAMINIEPRLVLIVVGVLTTWLFVSAIWEQSSNTAFSVFLFLSWGYYFFSYNTVRNFFALAISIYSMRFLRQRKRLYFILFVLLAALFHKSALSCLPSYFLSDIRWKKHYYFIVGIGILAALLLKEQLREFVFYFYPGYEGGAYDTERISYLNIVKAILAILLCLICCKKVDEDKDNRLYFHLNVLALALYTGMYWIPEISRIGFYLNTTSIFLLPNVLEKVKNRKNKKLLKFVVYLFSIILFYLLCKKFYRSTIQLLPYKSWLF